MQWILHAMKSIQQYIQCMSICWVHDSIVHWPYIQPSSYITTCTPCQFLLWILKWLTNDAVLFTRNQVHESGFLTITNDVAPIFCFSIRMLISLHQELLLTDTTGNWVVARANSVAARSMVMFKTCTRKCHQLHVVMGRQAAWLVWQLCRRQYEWF